MQHVSSLQRRGLAVAIQQEGVQNAPALPGVRGAAETGKEEWRVGSVSETRVCKKCNKEQSIELFKIHHKYRVWTCHDCELAYLSLWRKNNKEKVNARSRQLMSKRYWSSEECRQKKLSGDKKYREEKKADAGYRERRKLSAQKHFQSVPLRYVNALLGGTPVRPYPKQILEAKQIQIKIKRLLKDQHEKHN